MEEERLVEDSISMFGLRTMDVIRYGMPVDISPWVNQVPGEAAGLVSVIRRYEQGLNVHHAMITWNAREMVEFRLGPLRYGVLWYIGKGERMSYAIDMAASLYKTLTGLYPTRCWVQELPKDAPDEFTIEGFTNDPPTKPVSLRMAGWVPERFVCVGIEQKDLELVFENGKYIPKEAAHG